MHKRPGSARGGDGTSRSARQEAGRADMLLAAARLLSTHGYHGMTMRDLARATGMSLANLYNYFGSKEDLVFALQTRAFATLIESAIESVHGLAEPEARLHAFILSHVRYVATQSDIMRVLVEEAGELPRARRHAVRALKERYFQVGREIVAAIAEAHRDGTEDRPTDDTEIERATYSIFGMLNWVYGWYAPARHGTPQAVARTIHRLAMNGLVGQLPTRSSLAATERRVERVRVRSPIHSRDDGDVA
jgi:AcrR family transcriptional regulator